MRELSLKPEEVKIIIEGLLELQAKYSLDLIIKIDNEAKKQIEQQEKVIKNVNSK